MRPPDLPADMQEQLYRNCPVEPNSPRWSLAPTNLVDGHPLTKGSRESPGHGALPALIVKMDVSSPSSCTASQVCHDDPVNQHITPHVGWIVDASESDAGALGSSDHPTTLGQREGQRHDARPSRGRSDVVGYLKRSQTWLSGRMSIRHPVRRAARRAFWPSRPMARESW